MFGSAETIIPIAVAVVVIMVIALSIIIPIIRIINRAGLTIGTLSGHPTWLGILSFSPPFLLITFAFLAFGRLAFVAKGDRVCESPNSRPTPIKRADLICMAQNGDCNAQYTLAYFLETGRNGLKNITEAIEWYRLSAAQGHVEAQVALGDMYSQGKGIARNDIEAETWLLSASEKGAPLAQYKLGCLYQTSPVLKNYIKAYHWLNMAAASGTFGAAQKRDLLERQMSASDIVSAQSLSLSQSNP
jgi:hypothetical protein